ncbi:MAG: SDR family oxidoreductase [Myxococcales bacterium]|nr:SDR family oxidoreductase [Myxococcales bacterium]
MGKDWGAEPRLDPKGRRVVITGGNSGIGFEVAKMLAADGYDIVLACRNPDKAASAVSTISEAYPGASVRALALDLASLESVRSAAAELADQWSAVDTLINNAGVMALPRYQTADGFEMQFGTNHLGHFALTGLLLPMLEEGQSPRVVTVSSVFHKAGSMRWGDLQRVRRYTKYGAYGQSKLANLLFAFELQRRAERSGSPLISTACHPGYSATNLQSSESRRSSSVFAAGIFKVGNGLLAQSAEAGAVPTYYASTIAGLSGGEYFGPKGMMETRGRVGLATVARKARDEEAASRLWAESERLTGVSWFS